MPKAIATRQGVVRAEPSKAWPGMEPGGWIVTASVITASLVDFRKSGVTTRAVKQGTVWVGIGTRGLYDSTPFAAPNGRVHFATLHDLMQAALDLAL
jgi:hypothetical protein